MSSPGHFTYDAMASVLEDIRNALWAGVFDNYGYPEPFGSPFNRNGIPALRVKDSDGRAFVITAHPVES